LVKRGVGKDEEKHKPTGFASGKHTLGLVGSGKVRKAINAHLVERGVGWDR